MYSSKYPTICYIVRLHLVNQFSLYEFSRLYYDKFVNQDVAFRHKEGEYKLEYYSRGTKVVNINTNRMSFNCLSQNFNKTFFG